MNASQMGTLDSWETVRNKCSHLRRSGLLRTQRGQLMQLVSGCVPASSRWTERANAFSKDADAARVCEHYDKLKQELIVSSDASSPAKRG